MTSIIQNRLGSGRIVYHEADQALFLLGGLIGRQNVYFTISQRSADFAESAWLILHAKKTLLS